jgi:hypothetical protein
MYLPGCCQPPVKRIAVTARYLTVVSPAAGRLRTQPAGIEVQRRLFERVPGAGLAGEVLALRPDVGVALRQPGAALLHQVDGGNDSASSSRGSTRFMPTPERVDRVDVPGSERRDDAWSPAGWSSSNSRCFEATTLPPGAVSLVGGGRRGLGHDGRSGGCICIGCSSRRVGAVGATDAVDVSDEADAALASVLVVVVAATVGLAASVVTTAGGRRRGRRTSSVTAAAVAVSSAPLPPPPQAVRAEPTATT